MVALLALVYGTTYSIEAEVYAFLGIANALTSRAYATETEPTDTCGHQESSCTFAH